MTLPDRRDRAKALARTYGGDRDPWERVQEYQCVLEYRGEHPNEGSAAIAAALELPRGRIRPWFDGAKPDPVHAIDVAETHGWFDAAPGDPTFGALTVLHAWIFAGGSIRRDGFVPTFVVSDGDPGRVCESAIRQAGLDVREARPEEQGRARELVPGEGGTALGRFLHGVLGAPVGPKSERADLEFPAWLSAAPTATRLRWARTYVTLRGSEIDVARHGYRLQLAERRSERFRTRVGEFLTGLVDDGVTVGEHAILLRPGAADVLDRQPSLGG